MDRKTKHQQLKVFIACSIDGYIADEDGAIDWLTSIPNPEDNDMGYTEFIHGVDALLMGRRTFEKILSFEIDWPYTKPVFVLSNTLRDIPESLKLQNITILKGELQEILHQIKAMGHDSLYVDGGSTIRSCLEQDLIDEMIITTIPILLGSGIPLFGNIRKSLAFELRKSTIYLDQIVQSHYSRKKD